MLVTAVPCPARPDSSDSCPVAGGRSVCEHEHDADILAAAIVRNEAIDAACATFKAARDRLLKSTGGGLSYRLAIAQHEQDLDKAKDAAWSVFHKAVQS